MSQSEPERESESQRGPERARESQREPEREPEKDLSLTIKKYGYIY